MFGVGRASLDCQGSCRVEHQRDNPTTKTINAQINPRLLHPKITANKETKHNRRQQNLNEQTLNPNKRHMLKKRNTKSPENINNTIISRIVSIAVPKFIKLIRTVTSIEIECEEYVSVSEEGRKTELEGSEDREVGIGV